MPAVETEKEKPFEGNIHQPTLDPEDAEEGDELQEAVGSDDGAEAAGEAAEKAADADEQVSLGDDDDAATVATSAVGQGTTVSMPTTYFNRRAEEFHEQLRAEKLRRMQLENQMAALKDQLNITQAAAARIKAGDDADEEADNVEGKMRLIEMRNLLQTGENYTTHPQFENL